jgi:hypothetical protein
MPWVSFLAKETITGPTGCATVMTYCAAKQMEISSGPKITHLKFKITFQNIFKQKE